MGGRADHRDARGALMHALSVVGSMAEPARDAAALMRENAELRRQLMTAQRAAGDAEEALAISRQAHAVMTLQLAQLEKLVHELKRAAVKHPHQPLSRWVKFGPMATFLASIKDEA